MRQPQTSLGGTGDNLGMHSPPPSSALLRLVLACYLLVLGVAGASPLMYPQRMEMVCHGDGAMTLVAVDHDAAQHTLDCALCLAASLPAPPPQMARSATQPLAPAPALRHTAQVAARSGARFPPRGPPVLA